MGVFDNPTQMWFGTEQKMTWIEVPQSGANVGSVGNSVEETLLNGGGYARNSWGGHKRYEFSWGESADRKTVSQIVGYKRGTYGRGVIYFQDPMFYETNILPAHLADPSMALSYEAPSLHSGIEPRSTPTPANTNDLPALTTIYDLPPDTYTPIAERIVIAVPDGMTLDLGAIYTGTGTSRVFATSNAGTVTLPKLDVNATDVVSSSFTGPWVRVGIHNPDLLANQSISLVALVGRLRDSSAPINSLGPWTSGEGHTGCRFVGEPTVVAYNGVGGGQFGLAATLVEVGAWES